MEYVEFKEIAYLLYQGFRFNRQIIDLHAYSRFILRNRNDPMTNAPMT